MIGYGHLFIAWNAQVAEALHNSLEGELKRTKHQLKEMYRVRSSATLLRACFVLTQHAWSYALRGTDAASRATRTWRMGSRLTSA
eukprot:3940428-Rhodomonas_salina.3